MEDSDNLESWLTKNNISELLQILLDNEVEELSDLNMLNDESVLAEFIEELDINDGLESKFKNALSNHLKMQDTNKMDKALPNLATPKNTEQSQTETKMSCGDGDDTDKNHVYKQSLKGGVNIVASEKREYIVSELKENEYAYKGGNGYNEQSVIIKTTIRGLNADENK
eukprot:502961_1